MIDDENRIENQSPEMVDLVEIFHKIWEGRKTIFITISIFFLLGLIIALGTPKEYKSEVTLLVESSSKSGAVSGILQQFSGLAGINMKSGDEALTPELYPDIVKNVPFLLEILKQKVTESKNDSTLTVEEYLRYHRRSSLIQKIFGLPGNIIGLFRSRPSPVSRHQLESSGPFRLSNEQFSLVNSLSNCIIAQKGPNKFGNTLVIGVEMQDPYVAAQVNDSVVKCLQQYIIDYRTRKAKTDLNFVENRYKEAESRYLSAQQSLADYRDQHKNVILASSRTVEERLQSQYNLAFGIYNTISQQLEQSKMKVQENTPVFSVMNPAMVPLIKSRPKTNLILIAMLFLGGCCGIGIIYVKHTYSSYHKKGK